MNMAERAAEPGTFEFIEQKIRRDAKGTEFGGDFEWLCKWFLENAPKYRHELKQVWLWREWPDRWHEFEKGIDLIAKTRGGQLWAIQTKAHSPERGSSRSPQTSRPVSRSH